jgi:hypothetical protein
MVHIGLWLYSAVESDGLRRTGSHGLLPLPFVSLPFQRTGERLQPLEITDDVVYVYGGLHIVS